MSRPTPQPDSTRLSLDREVREATVVLVSRAAAVAGAKKQEKRSPS